MNSSLVMNSALFAFCTLIVAFIFNRLYRGNRSKNLPPGPPGKPLIGNLLNWPWEYGWLRFTDWAKLYGKLVHVQMLGVHIVILSDIELTQTLFNQAIFSDRPRLTMAGELMGFGPSIILCGYGEDWKVMRKLINSFLNKTSSRALLPSFTRDSHILLRSLLSEESCDYVVPIRYILGKNIIENAYGLPIEGVKNKYIRVSREAHTLLEHAVIPGNFLVDLFPKLKYIPSWFPGSGFLKHASMAASKRERMVDESFAEARTSAAEYSLVSTLLKNPPDNLKIEEDHYHFLLKWAAASLYGAGTESPTSALCTFIVMMALHPGIQKRAQEEIDAITQGKRLPTFDDQDKLPYIDAIMKEVVRFNPPAPMGIAHQLSEATVVNGYYIPQGTMVITNIWGMCRDARYYKDPHIFNPDRFLEISGVPELDAVTTVLGFGRRACPGYHYTRAVLFINMASILSAFSIKPLVEQCGSDPVFTGGFLSHPKPFPCKFIPRFEELSAFIHAAPIAD